MSEPILAGFHPDPSICRVGDEYYLVNSSFEYLPGVPVSVSRDLVRWRHIGHVLDRDEQITLPSGAGSGGIFAPTLRYHGRRFWMVTTNVARFADGHLIVWSEDPAGPWSAPVYTAGAVGVDPDLAWDDDGTCYLTWAVPGAPDPIRQARVDPLTGALRDEPVTLWSGTGLAYPEGPHLYRRGEWWYLLLAEGGTERGHAVTLARSRRPSGPFEPHPGNPPVGPLTQVLARAPLADGRVSLAIRTVPHPVTDGPAAGPDLVQLGHLAGGEFVAMAELDGRYLSTEVAAGFTGRVVGVEQVDGPSTIERFTYAPENYNVSPR
ncbi:glycoside hydrolase family 43 protein [Dactylosporangium darangshiense]|uniref:Uncharacterized protein n=1 Tax=Dactylosporangium darangshiense TaxID=579108 RepID=A0ABP8D7M3_9ACTN